ncbi:FG-GAP-like repeat-containing protein [Sorangium sp. So ce1099]|uniref:FG-GAP-like repeat-containing protein n=1 Tax=Sorangium sp. So ce1099 TaxID=3133331 RepID=UPI003F624A64
MAMIRHHRISSGLCAAVFWIASCAPEGPTSAPSWEEYRAAATKEFEGQVVYVIHGDAAVSLEELKAEYERIVESFLQQGSEEEVGASRQASTVNQWNGQDDLWPSAQAADLSYCVSLEFGADHQRAVNEMAAATLDWEAWGGYAFRYIGTQDSNCNNANPNVRFAVRPWDSGGACAFFPSGPGCVARTLVIDFDDLDTNPVYGAVTSVGVFRHELGHILGLRHEHVRVTPTWCSEDTNWRSVTGYDASSVMHYPWCPGAANTGDLLITNMDRAGINSLYPLQYASTNDRFEYQGDLGWWDSGGGYSADAVTGRMVSGDYDGDGRDDIAMFYKYTSSSGRVHVLLSTGASFQYQGDLGWWDSGGGYRADAVTGRMVTGDYNGDGRDDIAMFYKYTSSSGRVHVLLSTGASFQYQGDLGWWDSGGGYSADAVTGRMVSGDYNGDGRDDIAMLYKYTSSSGRVHVLLSTGASFQYQGDLGWWDSGGGYSADAVTGRMVSGDYNGDGRDDIAMLYKYSPSWARAHVLLSTGVSFQYQGDVGWWDSADGYSADAVAGRVVSGDYNGDGHDDIVMFYKYGPSWGRAHVLLSTGASFAFQGELGWWHSGSGYSADAFAERMVSGDYNGDGQDDIAMFYKYTASSGRTHVLLSH